MDNKVNKFSFVLIFSLLLINISALKAQLYKDYDSPLVTIWVDSVYNSLSLDEKIGQLIFVRANYSGKPYLKEVDGFIKDYNIGGVVFFRSDPLSQALKTNYWNSMSKTPLMVAMDAEWGIGMRLSNTVKYPLQMALGAVSDDSLIYTMGKQIAWQCKRMGVHMNYAPVVDVNSNAANPVIGMRSFGENPQSVATKAYLYMKGMQDNGIIACAKHFPGHGDTKSDSHLTLPLVSAKKKDLRKTELLPFQYLIDHGVASIMTAHLSVPALDKNKKRPTSLSYKVVTKLLKKKMGFDGLIVTDGLDMKGVTKYYKRGNVAKEAFMAGNDILLIPADVKASVESIRALIQDKPAYSARLARSCKKILKFKYLSGAYKAETIDTTNLLSELNNPGYHSLSKQLSYDAITIVKNNDRIIPLSRPDTLKTAVLVIGYKNTEFEKVISDFMPADVYYLSHDADIAKKQDVLNSLHNANLVIVALTNTNISAARRYGISNEEVQFISKIASLKRTILNVFASPYALNFFPNLNDFDAVMVSYQDKQYIMHRSAEILLGMAPAEGRLPVSTAALKAGFGISTPKTRLTFKSPEDMGIDISVLDKIDSIAQNGIDIQAYPGCQVLAAKDGYIFYDKSFGYHTYNKKIAVRKDDLYDLASLTKILATTPSLMKIYQDTIIDIDKPISDYLLYLKKSNKKNILIKEILSHQAGLYGWIPYYESTLSLNSWDTAIYRSQISEEYPKRVALNMYIHEGYNYNIYKQIASSPLGEKKYKYSDLGFYLFRQLIELSTNSSLDEYVLSQFYLPLGLKTMRFRPLRFFEAGRICPTENDREFRYQLLQGDVHDQGAAMLGGVSGHAGLFSDSYDVAVMMQMFLNGGNYGGHQYINSSVINEFTSRHFEDNENRRGLGFDKPLLEYEDHGPNCKSASSASFGHSGFTGTYTWADPETGLVYVFLSNRVNPDMHNNKLGDLDIRTNIHQLFYDAIGD
jgi:beta-glucosidase-like glycosyl hydrolase/CubicO group peptidase (beta-lactamase class C family)